MITIRPQYPHNLLTLLGVSSLPVNSLTLYKYRVILHTRDQRILSGQVVSHLSLENWCEMKGYQVIVNRGARVAAPSDRTVLGMGNL